MPSPPGEGSRVAAARARMTMFRHSGPAQLSSSPEEEASLPKHLIVYLILSFVTQVRLEGNVFNTAYSFARLRTSASNGSSPAFPRIETYVRYESAKPELPMPCRTRPR
jgi:hypothetical protein